MNKKLRPARPTNRLYLTCLSALSLLAANIFGAADASARSKTSSRHGKASASHHARSHHVTRLAHHRIRHRYRGGRVIQCVAYAKTASNVHLHGNARDWWRNAAGIYARGAAPEAGAVLNFRPIRRMPLGHVAVVRQLVNDRTIIIDQSHWGQRGVARNTRVIDVSPNNDWSAVRVAINGHPESFGSIYPTYGFIYERPDQGMMLAHEDSSSAARKSAVAPRISSLRNTEVAQVPETAFSVDGPEHRLQ
ncbi:CHAP domain-containing protein [Sorlinia euscelidii]|uniref:Peptidase C51 domain-containing protein n=1 Tax=Sorlinia euscelidii TaxID=3081148 RepID=A0ABU7TYV5_9PROT